MNDDLSYPPGTNPREIAIRRRVHRLAEFYQHCLTFVVVISGLWALNAYYVWGGYVPDRWVSWWAVWPTFGWGIGLVAHGLSVLPVWGFFSTEWEERKVRELMERERK
jgi:hypothetical protein